MPQSRPIARALRVSATVLCVAVGYFAIARLTLSQLFFVDWEVVPVWPAAGWAVASVARWRRVGLAGVVLGSLAYEAQQLDGAPWLLAVTGVCLEALVGACLIHRLRNQENFWLSRVRDLPLLAAFAASAATLSASLGVASRCLAGTFAWSTFGTGWLVFWLGDFLGVLFVAPVLLMWFGSRQRLDRRQLAELVAVAVSALSLSGIIFAGLFKLPESALGAFFPLLIWASLRVGALGASSASLVICGLALWGTAHGVGPFAHGASSHQIGLLWTFLAVVLLTTFVFSSMLEERRSAQKELGERESLLNSFYDGSTLMMGIVETQADDLVLVSCNAALASFLGRTPESLRGRRAHELGVDEGRAVLWRDKCGESRATGRPVRFEYVRACSAGKQTMAATVCSIPSDAAPRFSFVVADVSERVRAGRERDRFFTLSLDMLCIAGLDGSFKRVNPSFTETLGVSERDLLGRAFVDLVHPDDRARAVAELESLGDGKQTIAFECRFRRADESYRWFAWTAMTDPEDQLIYAAARDVTDAKAAARDLRNAKERAEAATQAKSEFLANMSHELRTPLGAISGMAELIERTPLNMDQREYVDGIRQSTNTLLLLVNDLLDLEKIESGRLEIESAPLEPEKVLSDAFKSLVLSGHRKGLELVYNLSPNVPRELMGDATRLQQIVTNLVSNAVKFTERGHVAVDVDAAAQDDGVELRVRVADSGIGIPEDRQAEVFEAFVQADGSTTRKHGGTGLGLAICSRLVDLMGGRIWVESEMGRGTTFQFTARLERSPSAGDEQMPEDKLEPMRVLVVDPSAIARRSLSATLRSEPLTVLETDTGENALELERRERAEGRRLHVAFVAYAALDDGSSGWLEKLRDVAPKIRIVLLTRTSDRLTDDFQVRLGVDGRLAKPVPPRHVRKALRLLTAKGVLDADEPMTDTMTKSTRRLKVLVVDDDRLNRVVTTKLLRAAGHDVEEAENGRVAVDRTGDERFDLVFMDIQMPELDGIGATSAIRRREREGEHYHTPIVALTANARKEDRDRCRGAGMDDYLAKPVEPRRLIAAAEHVANRAAEAPRHREAMPAPAAPATALVDAPELLASLQGDEATLRELLQHFLEATPVVASEIRAAIDDGDCRRVERGAHRLKGTLLTLRARSAAETLLRVEEAARERRPSALERSWNEVTPVLDAVSHEVERLLHRVSEPATIVAVK